jgi:5-carboxymethyl-2-hydroxymuconate isomerase
MPHIIIESSKNVRDRCEMSGLIGAVHDAALETGIFPIGGLRTRLFESTVDNYRIADGDEDNAFVHISVRIAQGRDLETKRRAGQAIFDAACLSLTKAYEGSPLAISLEIQEIDADLSFKKNNLHDYVKRRAAEAPRETKSRFG